jgi:transcriptional regulator with XRE-family HTH domain
MEQFIPIGERIAAQRRRRGISQAQLAHRLGRSEQWLSNIERGVRPADRYSLLNSIAGELRVPVTELTGEAPRLLRDPAEQHQAVQEIRWP